MVSVYGMSDKVGNRSYYDSSGQNTNFTKPYSEATAKIIDEEVSNLINKAYSRAKEIQRNQINKLVELAELLLEKEVIYKENLEKIKKSPELFKVEFRRLVMLLKKESAEDKDWEVFKSYFSEVHNNFDNKIAVLSYLIFIYSQ